MVQAGLRWCKMVQHGARWCKIVQDSARYYKILQDDAITCNIMQNHAIICNTMQCHATPCNTMQYHAIQCKTMKYHASLITADGAYHCPVGSIKPFLFHHSPWAGSEQICEVWFTALTLLIGQIFANFNVYHYRTILSIREVVLASFTGHSCLNVTQCTASGQREKRLRQTCACYCYRNQPVAAVSNS